MKKFMLLLVISLICITTQKFAYSAPKDRTVYVESGNLFDVGPSAPLVALVSALEKNPQVNRFRLTWGSGASQGPDWATAIYDRKKRILWLESSGDYLSNEESDIPERTKYVRRWLFKNVTDRSLKSLTAKYRKSNELGPLTYLPHLTEFGCTMQKIKDWSQVYKVPQKH